MTTPCIITVAITGSLPRKKDNPVVLISIAEQIESTQHAFEAVATLVHLHVRNDDESPTSNPDRFAKVLEGIRKQFRCIYGLRTQPDGFSADNRFSCNGTLPVGPERSVVTRTASSERKLMLMDAMSEFDASDRNCCIAKRLEAFH